MTSLNYQVCKSEFGGLGIEKGPQIKLNPGLNAALCGESSIEFSLGLGIIYICDLIIIIISLFVHKVTKCLNLKNVPVLVYEYTHTFRLKNKIYFNHFLKNLMRLDMFMQEIGTYDFMTTSALCYRKK